MTEKLKGFAPQTKLLAFLTISGALCFTAPAQQSPPYMVAATWSAPPDGLTAIAPAGNIGTTVVRWDNVNGGTWRYLPLQGWNQVFPPQSPPAPPSTQLTPSVNRVYPAMAGGVRSMVMFGGFDSGLLGDTWTFQLNTSSTTGWWTQVTTGPAPSPRYGHAMAAVTNSSGTRVFLFGGSDGSVWFGDLWVFNSGSWSQVPVAPGPTARQMHSMTGLPDGTLLLFGGADSTGLLNDTWLFDPAAVAPTPSWTPVSTPVQPSPRALAALVYDRVNDRAVMSCGAGLSWFQIFQDSWELQRLPGGFSWRQLPSAATPPLAGVEMIQEPNSLELLVTTKEPVPVGLTLATSTVDVSTFPTSPWTCSANQTTPLLLQSGTSLPLLGGTFDLTISGADPAGLLLVGIEVSGARTPVALGCQCTSFLTGGPNTIPLLVPNVGPLSPLGIQIANDPNLQLVTIDFQAFHLDGSACSLKSTPILTAYPGF